MKQRRFTRRLLSSRLRMQKRLAPRRRKPAPRQRLARGKKNALTRASNKLRKLELGLSAPVPAARGLLKFKDMIKRFLLIVCLFWVIPPLAFTYWNGAEFIQALRGWTFCALLLAVLFGFITMHEAEPSPAPLDDMRELED